MRSSRRLASRLPGTIPYDDFIQSRSCLAIPFKTFTTFGTPTSLAFVTF
jgi:hypothetical protein